MTYAYRHLSIIWHFLRDYLIAPVPRINAPAENDAHYYFRQLQAVYCFSEFQISGASGQCNDLALCSLVGHRRRLVVKQIGDDTGYLLSSAGSGNFVLPRLLMLASQRRWALYR